MAASRRKTWDSLTPTYRKRIERTIGRSRWESGEKLYEARGQKIEKQRVEHRAAQRARGDRVDVSDSTKRKWKRIAKSRGIDSKQFEYQWKVRGPQWVGGRVHSWSQVDKMRAESDDPSSIQDYMQDEYRNEKEFDVESAWFYYGVNS